MRKTLKASDLRGQNTSTPSKRKTGGQTAATPTKVLRRSQRLAEMIGKNETNNGEVDISPPQEADVPPQDAVLVVSSEAPENQYESEKEVNEERIVGDTVLLSFPPKGLTQSQVVPVSLSMDDAITLSRKKMINDTIIMFMINVFIVFRIDRKLLSTIHWFNSFLYSTITRNLPSRCFSGRNAIIDDLQKILITNCTKALRWTKKFDVFTKDYIVIPINEDYHWLLITIFNPSGAIVNVNDEENSRIAPKCYVAFFDPLSGLEPTKRNHMCHCITTYLEQVYINTKAPGTKYGGNQNTIYDPSRVIVTVPKGLPIQGNYFDCGLYVLSYIEGLFCYLNRPITVHDFPHFNWAEQYPAATEMAELMRDKVYNTILKVSTPENKTRLSRFEKQERRGMSLEGHLRKGRRHSADRKRRVPRHEEYRPRRYSVHTRERLLIETPLFMNPRAWAEMPCTIEARSIRWPEENFVCLF